MEKRDYLLKYSISPTGYDPAPLTVRDKGSVLILALWTLLFLSLLAFYSGTMVRQDILLMGRLEERTRLYDVSLSGAMMGMEYMMTLAEEQDWDFDTLNAKWADNPSIFKDVKMGGGSFSLEYDHRDNINGRTVVRYGLKDEESKINLNHAGKNILARLLARSGGIDPLKAEILADSIIDWIDADDIKNGSSGNESEKVEYNNAGFKYSPSNLPFTCIEEFLFVKGADMKTFCAIRDFITVFGNGKININTASREVLSAAGLSDEVIYKIISYRAGIDMTEGSFDDNAFESKEDITDNIMGYSGLNPVQVKELEDLVGAGILDVKSSVYTAKCVGTAVNGGSKGNMILIFEKNGIIHYIGYIYMV